MTSLPRLDADLDRLEPIAGQPPTPGRLPSGCPFHPRCPIGHDRELCRTEEPPLRVVAERRTSACHFPEEVASIGDTDFSALEESLADELVVDEEAI